MTDREKVIKGLEDSLANQGCGYMDGVGELYAVSGEDLQNAIALLKEQEPKQVIKQTCHIMVEGGYENPVVFTSYDLLCPTCKSLLCRGIDVIDDNYHFCKVCGQAVKWE